MPHLQRGPSARMGRSVGLLCGKPRRLRWQPGRENALQAGGEEMQELWHLSRTHCGCQQTNLGYLHQWKDEFSRGQVRVETFVFFLSVPFLVQVLSSEAHDHQDCQPDDRPTDTGEIAKAGLIVIADLTIGHSSLCLQDGRRQGWTQR